MNTVRATMPSLARRAGSRLTLTERRVLALGALLAAAQLGVMVQFSQASVANGERLRAEQAARAADLSRGQPER